MFPLALVSLVLRPGGSCPSAASRRHCGGSRLCLPSAFGAIARRGLGHMAPLLVRRPLQSESLGAPRSCSCRSGRSLYATTYLSIGRSWDLAEPVGTVVALVSSVAEALISSPVDPLPSQSPPKAPDCAGPAVPFYCKYTDHGHDRRARHSSVERSLGRWHDVERRFLRQLLVLTLTQERGSPRPRGRRGSRSPKMRRWSGLATQPG